MVEFAVIFLLIISILHESSSFHASNVAHTGSNRRFDLNSKVSSSIDSTSNRTVTILERGPNHIVALKPPSVVCHHSGWTGSRSKAKRGEEPEIPMLQRVRDAIHDIDSRNAGQDGDERTMRRVNLVHRLDRGASGALLFAFADDEGGGGDDDDNDDDDGGEKGDISSAKGATANLIEAMASNESTKTYVALVRGEGILRGEDLKAKEWFEVTRPIKDESGEEKDATTMFNFVAGQPETDEDGIHKPRISLVLARPKQGRWHQIRKHLRSLSHPILGDTTHGASTVNREWKEKRNMPGERICLHMARMQLPPTDAVPEGIDVASPMLDDMLNMLKVYAPALLEEARPILKKEGIIVEATQEYEVGQYTIPEELLRSKKNEDTDVEILAQGENYVVANKPPSVVVHHSSWTGKKTDPKRRWNEATPMLQRVRDKTGKRVNPVHRLDRGASGCLLFSFAQEKDGKNEEDESCAITRTLIESMKSTEATKTYIALCDGDGTWNGVNYLEKGWFTLDLKVKDEWGKMMQNCYTDIRFIASKTFSQTDDDENMEGRKVTVVLARPSTGKWHQVRQHLASGTIGHAILGDSSHGRSRTNRVWRKKRNLQEERTCLHLARLQTPATEYTPDGIDVSCPLPKDLEVMFSAMPDLLEEAKPILLDEGIHI